MIESMTVEVDLLDPDGEVVGHGTCTLDFVVPPGSPARVGGFKMHSFRSSAKPDDDWLLPPLHSFVLGAPLIGDAPVELWTQGSE